MKKKVNYIIFLLISMFALSMSVSADSKTCEYSNYSNRMATPYKVKLTINDNGTASANIVVYEGKTVNSQASVINWITFKSEYNSNGSKCPYYISLTYKSSNLINEVGSSVYVSYDSDASILNQGKVKLKSNSYDKDSGTNEDKNSAEEELQKYAQKCLDLAKINFDYKNCWDETKATTKYTECKKKAADIEYDIRNFGSQANRYIQDKILTTDNSYYKAAINACDAALKNVNEYQKKLDLTSCEDYKKATGVDIECTVNENEYDPFKEAKEKIESDEAKKSEYESESIEFLNICDPNDSPQTVATFKLIGIFISIIKIVAPIIIIVMGMLDLFKAVSDGKDGSIQKQLISFLKRVIACLLIFFVPNILLELFHFVDGWDDVRSEYEVCVNCILGDPSCPKANFVNVNGNNN